MALQAKHNETDFRVGDMVRVHYRIIEREKVAGKTKRSIEEKEKTRIQPFEGLVTSIKGSEENKSFTVRRLADQNIGVERVFPMVSPWIEKVEVKSRGKVRRAKLHYLRKRGNLEVKQIRPESKKSKASKKGKVSKTQISKDSNENTKSKKSKKTSKKVSSKKSGEKKGAKRGTSRKKASSK